MNKELKILAVVVVLTLITYWGVEPFAHSQMHPHVDPANFSFSKADAQTAKEKVEAAKIELNIANDAKDAKAIKTAKEDLASAQAFEKNTSEFWAKVDPITKLKGDAKNGETLATSNCTACHSIKAKGFPQVMDNASSAAAYGVVPPDLSTAGYLYSKEYLAGFIYNPVQASDVSHKFVDGKVHPMPAYNWMQPQEIADIVAYFESIAPKKMTNKEVYTDACQRCHSIKYGDMQKGTMTAFTPVADIKKYMGKIPPDLSQYIRSRGHEYLTTFINSPQKHLEGTAMPRVGLDQKAQKQVISYLEEVGDAKKDERNSLGYKFLIYLAIFAVFAWLWKKKVWREVH